MRTSHEPWKLNVYPLCGVPHDLLPHRYSRKDCLAWLAENYPGRNVPRSACIACPYHNNEEWRAIKADPVQWADAVEFDNAIRNCGGQRGKAYLHRSLIPLEEIDFRTAEEKGQGNLFNNECQGFCGV